MAVQKIPSGNKKKSAGDAILPEFMNKEEKKEGLQPVNASFGMSHGNDQEKKAATGSGGMQAGDSSLSGNVKVKSNIKGDLATSTLSDAVAISPATANVEHSDETLSKVENSGSTLKVDSINQSQNIGEIELSSSEDDSNSDDTVVNATTAKLNLKVGNPTVTVSGNNEKDTNESKTGSARVENDVETSLDDEVSGKLNVTANAINDAATAKDEIGFTPYVNALSKMIVHKNTQTPLVVGLYGPWGTGKTSFMHQVEAAVQKNELIKNSKINHSIFFEAWQYQNTKNLSGALLFNILKKLEAKNFWKSTCFRFKNAFKQFNLAAVLWNTFLIVLTIYFYLENDSWQFLVALPLLGLFLNKESHEFVKGLKVPMGIDIEKLLTKNDETLQATALHDFKPELKKVIDSFIPKEGRLILYIDDLDRCTPPQVVSILETLSVLFDSDKCVFVLGIDKPKVIRAIEAHYKIIADKTNRALNLHEKRYGEAFLEKIIQLPLVVPSLDQSSINQLSFSLIKELNNTRQRTDEGELAKNPEPKVLDESDLEYDRNTAIKLKECTLLVNPVTPRSIKSFINKFRFIYLLWSSNMKTFSNVQAENLPFWFLLNELFPYEINLLRERCKNNVLEFDDHNGSLNYESQPIARKILDYEKHEKNKMLMKAYQAFVAHSHEIKLEYFKLIQNTSVEYGDIDNKEKI